MPFGGFVPFCCYLSVVGSAATAVELFFSEDCVLLGL